VLLRGDTQLVIERMVPDLLHVIPVSDDAVFDGIFQGEDAPLGLCLVSNIRVLLSHSDHDAPVPKAADDGGEDSARSVITSEPGLAHAGAIIHHQSGNFVVTHCA